MYRSLVLLIPFMALGAGCAIPTKEEITSQVQQSVQQAAERGAEEIAKQRIGQDVDFDLNAGGATFTDPITGRTIVIGQHVIVPDNFPSDIPQYPGSTPTSVSVDTAAGTASLLFLTKDARTAIRAWYEAEAVAQGWQKEGALETADNIILSFTRASGAAAKLTVTVMPQNLQKEVSVLVIRKGE